MNNEGVVVGGGIVGLCGIAILTGFFGVAMINLLTDLLGVLALSMGLLLVYLGRVDELPDESQFFIMTASIFMTISLSGSVYYTPSTLDYNQLSLVDMLVAMGANLIGMMLTFGSMVLLIGAIIAPIIKQNHQNSVS